MMSAFSYPVNWRTASRLASTDAPATGSKLNKKMAEFSSCVSTVPFKTLVQRDPPLLGSIKPPNQGTGGRSWSRMYTPYSSLSDVMRVGYIHTPNCSFSDLWHAWTVPTAPIVFSCMCSLPYLNLYWAVWVAYDWMIGLDLLWKVKSGCSMYGYEQFADLITHVSLTGSILFCNGRGVYIGWL